MSDSRKMSQDESVQGAAGDTEMSSPSRSLDGPDQTMLFWEVYQLRDEDAKNQEYLVKVCHRPFQACRSLWQLQSPSRPHVEQENVLRDKKKLMLVRTVGCRRNRICRE
mmetsp:Transcript_39761/g.80132  ORF Transcript_39761/g.80132 Transcript_39761/m.80132 type:complete len:109 (-) Transcript_39761:712-1038(-)